ncbi:MAG: histidinol-phosphate aminotransferase family protein [Acidobacteriia bacterium]|nr:histidinol-phosphate aminotransferase family protein [Terriglobia bacterium]
MSISRRKLLGKLGAAAIAGAGINALEGSARAAQSMDMPMPPHREGGTILLNRNENAYGPSAQVVLAMQRSLTRANRFPRKASEDLASQIAAFHKVKPDQVVVGCGSTEIFKSAVDAYLGSGKTLILSSPTFDVIGTYASASGARVASVPLSRFWSNDLDGMLGRVDASTGLIYICNPNNPTAILNSRSELETFIGKLPANVRVIIDEAYHHYAGNSSSYASFIDRPMDDERVIVTRTFSKIHALAGLRVGYAIAGAQTARALCAHSFQENLNVVAAEAAMAALLDTQSVQVNIQRNADNRQEFLNQAYARMMRPLDSHTNFVMFKTVRTADELIDHFRQYNIQIGPRYPSMENYIRVSIGLPEEMKEFWRVWDLMPFINKMAM